MGKKTWVIIGVLVLGVSILGFTKANKKGYSSLPVCDQIDENERFECERDQFNNKENTELRAERTAAKEAKKVKDKADAAQDKGEGQFKVKF